MNKKSIVVVYLFFLVSIFAGTNNVTELEHMVVTATATDKQIMKVPYLMDVVTSEDIQNDNMSQTVPDALQYIHGDAAWVDGKQDIYNSSTGQMESDVISRLMPLTLHLGLRWDVTDKIWVSTLITHMNDADRLSASDMKDSQRIPEGGTPGWTRWDVKAGVKISENVEFSAGCENIADVDYRIHGSGNNEAGINFIAALNVTSW